MRRGSPLTPHQALCCRSRTAGAPHGGIRATSKLREGSTVPASAAETCSLSAIQRRITSSSGLGDAASGSYYRSDSESMHN